MHKLAKLGAVVCLGLGSLSLAPTAGAYLSGGVSYFSQDYGNNLKATGTRFNLSTGLSFSFPSLIGPSYYKSTGLAVGLDLGYSNGTLNTYSNGSNSYYDLSAGVSGTVTFGFDYVQPFVKAGVGYTGARFYSDYYYGGHYYEFGVGAKLLNAFTAGVTYRHSEISRHNHDLSANSYSVYVGVSF
ncbi:hypothetical protein CJP74_07070 [Psittacicella melopsittaci]|uniref:Outer membrane protein beta-barrel domain-containing protein n=1 Tax=Psittacicella melopsittaci TaxID=2028576 RepID=A0A3A1Y1S6_9GAMM|nr:outer membrane beta-barrel protein [Psittacicella melopsittaci]RIY31515.1 hypothetical protein CJP74_07070 [Psittacicella melopsittaci]